jgi:hypothetical protein
MMLAIVQPIGNRFAIVCGRAIMTLKGWAIAAGIVLLTTTAVHAATEANFGPATTADLVELCTATPDNAIGTAAVHFCEGFAQARFRLKCRIWLRSVDHFGAAALIATISLLRELLS